MKNLPPTQIAQADGQALEYVVVGKGAPTVVLLNGSGGPIEGWWRLFPEQPQLGVALVAYNRPGLGRSGKPATAQTGEAVVATLRSLLKTIALSAPCVLVGHSLGGLFAQLYARRYPDEVAGVVFVEAATPEDVENRPATALRLQRFLDHLSPPDPNHETQHVLQTIGQIRDAGPFPPVPVHVVTGQKRARQESQRALAALSPQGRHTIATRSGHFPQFTEPDLVVAAIRDVLTRERSPS